MKHFFRGGEGLSCGQSDKDLSSHPIEQNNRFRDRLSTMSPSGLLLREAHRNDEREAGQSVINLVKRYPADPLLVRSSYRAGKEPVGAQDDRFHSAQGLPLSGLDSAKTRSIPDGSPMNPRSPSGRDRRTIGSSSGKSGICPGSGRYPVGASAAYLSPTGGVADGSQARNNQGTTEKQAKRQQSPEKEPQIGNAFAGGNEVSDRREVVTLFAPCSPLVRTLFGKCLPILYRLSTDCLLFLYVFCRETVDKH
uniref:hypothetical protein n=2 Tax=Sphingobacterium TaxID=28453 RepID=UPI0013DC5FDA